MKINQMKKDEYFEGFYLIKRAEVRKTRAGKDYIAFTFQDDSGEISGNLWDAQPYNVEEFTAGRFIITRLKSIKLPCDSLYLVNRMIRLILRESHR